MIQSVQVCEKVHKRTTKPVKAKGVKASKVPNILNLRQTFLLASRKIRIQGKTPIQINCENMQRDAYRGS